MPDSIFDTPLVLAGPTIILALCAFALAGLLVVRRHVLPRMRIQAEDSEYSGTMVQAVMVFYGLAVALIAVSVATVLVWIDLGVPWLPAVASAVMGVLTCVLVARVSTGCAIRALRTQPAVNPAAMARKVSANPNASGRSRHHHASNANPSRTTSAAASDGSVAAPK